MRIIRHSTTITQKQSLFTLAEFSLAPSRIATNSCRGQESIIKLVKSSSKKMSAPIISKSSEKSYKHSYQRFMAWCTTNNISDFAEQEIIRYFTDLHAKGLKASSLFSKFSMIKSSLKANQNIDLDTYEELKKYLKEINKGYKTKATKTFSKDEFDMFIKEAPDRKYLATKAILIVGITGICWRDELVSLTMDNIQNSGPIILIHIEKRQGNLKSQERTVSIIEPDHVILLNKYISKRPAGFNEKRFFLRYGDNVCWRSVIGVNKISNAPRDAAKFLDLPDWKEFTGHSIYKTGSVFNQHGNRIRRPRTKLFENEEYFKQEVESDCDMDDPVPMLIENTHNTKTQCNVDLTVVDGAAQENNVITPPEYERIYNKYCAKRKGSITTEETLLVYFKRCVEKDNFAKATMLFHYTALKKLISKYENVDITQFTEVKESLNKLSTKHTAKSYMRDFTKKNITDFVARAPNDKYLHVKVALFFSAYGRLGANELVALRTDEIEDVDVALIVRRTIPYSDTKCVATITNQKALELYRKYLAVLPEERSTQRLFYRYDEGTCENVVMSSKYVSKFPYIVAKFLKLPHMDEYSAHSLRRLGDVFKRAERGLKSKKTTANGNECIDNENQDVEVSSLSDKIINATASTFSLSDCVNCKINIFITSE